MNNKNRYLSHFIDANVISILNIVRRVNHNNKAHCSTCTLDKNKRNVAENCILYVAAFYTIYIF